MGEDNEHYSDQDNPKLKNGEHSEEHIPINASVRNTSMQRQDSTQSGNSRIHSTSKKLNKSRNSSYYGKDGLASKHSSKGSRYASRINSKHNLSEDEVSLQEAFDPDSGHHYEQHRHSRSNRLSNSRNSKKFSTLRSRRTTRIFSDEDNTDFQPDIYEGDEDIDPAELTLKDRQEYLNVAHPFGLPLWKPALYKKSRSVTRHAKDALHSIPSTQVNLSFGNVIWFLLFGWWLSTAVYLVSLPLFLIPGGGVVYGRLLFYLAWYLSWPFSKYVEKINCEDVAPILMVAGDEEPLLGGQSRINLSQSSMLPGKVVYYIIFYLVVAPLMILVSLINWLMVFSVPMAKLNYVLVKKLRRIPLKLRFRRGEIATLEGSEAHPSLCTNHAFGLGYYKYTYDGINILFINLMAVVFFTLADAYVLTKIFGEETWVTSPFVIFTGCLASTIPLAYFIGMAVSSISAQSSLGLGAVINATFGSIVEILLYCFALIEGKAVLVEGSIIGSMLAGLLLMPGFSMIGGATKRKQQRFNAKSAGVTSTMLIMSVIGVFTPTLFYSIYATFELKCTSCPVPTKGGHWACKGCAYYQPHPSHNPFYYERTRPLMYICAFILPLAYLICLWFTLRTHTSLIYSNKISPSKALHSLYKKLLPTHIIKQLSNPNPPEHEEDKTHKGDVEDNIDQDHNDEEIVNPVSTSSSNGTINPANSPTSLKINDTNVQEVTRLNSTMLPELVPLPLSVHPSLLEGVHYDPEQHRSIVNTAQQILNTDHDDDDDEEDDEEVAGHDAPEWSKFKSSVILCSCTVLFAIIAELMVQCVDVVVESLHIPEKILGLTLFALVPNVTEFVNAISFAMHGNIPLSMEIGSAYTVQVALLQIPALVAFSAYYHWHLDKAPMSQTFTLIFPRLDMFSVLFSVFLITYIYIEGKSNYFKGSILVLTYTIWLSAFALEPPASHASGNLSIPEGAIPIPPLLQRYYV